MALLKEIYHKGEASSVNIFTQFALNFILEFEDVSSQFPFSCTSHHLVIIRPCHDGPLSLMNCKPKQTYLSLSFLGHGVL